MRSPAWLFCCLLLGACAPVVTEVPTEPFQPGATPSVAWITLKNDSTCFARHPRVEHDSLVWVARTDGGDIEPNTPLDQIERHAIAMSDIKEIRVPAGGGKDDEGGAGQTGWVLGVLGLVGVLSMIVLLPVLWGGGHN